MQTLELTTKNGRLFHLNPKEVVQIDDSVHGGAHVTYRQSQERVGHIVVTESVAAACGRWQAALQAPPTNLPDGVYVSYHGQIRKIDPVKMGWIATDPLPAVPVRRAS